MLNLVRRGSDEELGLAAQPESRALAEAEAEIARLRQVLRVVGHEVGNSLGPMKSLLASARVLAERQGGTPRLDGVLGTVEERAAHLQAFIGDCIGDCVRTSALAGRRPAAVDWQRLVARLECLYPELIVEGVPAHNGTGDAVQLEQALINLVKNAREAGGPTAELRLVFEDAPDGATRVSVLDRGCGMTDLQLAALARHAFTTKPGGSGIGLGLCRTIAERHGGRLTIERRTGGGMKIGLWLPARERVGLAA